MRAAAEIARRLAPAVTGLPAGARVLVTGGSGFLGTHLVAALRERCHVTNLDILPPRDAAQARHWRELDLRDAASLRACVRDLRPDLVLHAAARTDLAGRRVEDYASNTRGTAALLEALDGAGFSGSAVFFSSMLTSRPGRTSAALAQGDPDTAYGESKLAMEAAIVSARPAYRHCVVRPTSIWGPWFGEPYRAFFQLVARGRYFHPGAQSATKTFGFVANTMQQVLTLARLPPATPAPIYLGDAPPVRVADWAEEIAALAGVRRPLRVPGTLATFAAAAGDAAAAAGLRLPLTSRRLRNLRDDHVVDLRPIQALVPGALFSRLEGTRLTLDWLREAGALKLRPAARG